MVAGVTSSWRRVGHRFLAIDQYTDVTTLETPCMGNPRKKTITLIPKPLNDSDWQIEVRFPSSRIVMIVGFESEADALQWIRNRSKAWLKTRGYDDE